MLPPLPPPTLLLPATLVVLTHDSQGLAATYGNLLELFKTAGHSQCAGVVCEVLQKKKHG